MKVHLRNVGGTIGDAITWLKTQLFGMGADLGRDSGDWVSDRVMTLTKCCCDCYLEQGNNASHMEKLCFSLHGFHNGTERSKGEGEPDTGAGAGFAIKPPSTHRLSRAETQKRGEGWQQWTKTEVESHEHRGLKHVAKSCGLVTAGLIRWAKWFW